MAQKTKATMPGRQCRTENKEQRKHTRLTAGGQSVSAMHFCILGTAPMAQLVQLSQSPKFSGATISKIVSCILNVGCTALQHTPYLNCCRGGEPVAHTLLLHTSFRVAQLQLGTSPQNWGNPDFGYRTCTKNAGRTPELESAQFFCINFSHAGRSKSFSLLPHVFDVLKHDFNMKAATIKTKAIHSIFFISYPFDSIPRCCNSLRIIRLIQAASDSSPSCCWACSISSRNSGSSLNWNGGLPRLSFLCVDTLITPDVMCLCVMTHYIHALQIATPRSAGTLPRRLTKPLSEVTTMAELQHTQTRPEFTWLFLATPKHYPECAPVVLRFDADTEACARAAFPGWELVFAAKIRAQAPCRVSFFDYATRRGWEFDSAASQEVRHA